MKIGRLKVTASGFPWQIRGGHWSTKEGGKPWGWGKCDGMGRFGGGWDYKLGVMIGSRSFILDILLGTIRIERTP